MDVHKKKSGRGEWYNVRFAVAYISLHLLDWYLRFCLFFHSSAAHLYAHYMASYALVSSFLVFVADDEYHIETRENGSLEIDVLARSFEIIVATEDGIRCREY